MPGEISQVPETLKAWEWLFDKGLSYGLSIYFVWYFTSKIDPKLTELVSSLNSWIKREEARTDSFETVIRTKTQTAETVTRIEHLVEKINAKVDAISIHVQK